MTLSSIHHLMSARKFILSGIPFIFCLLAARAQDLAHLKDQKPVTFHGNISAGLNYYSDLSGKDDSLSTLSFGRSPSYFIQANPVLSLYGVAIPVNLMIAGQNKSFHTPFNRFGMSPYYKWAKLHLGWRSLNFSQFTLGGQQMLGAGFELTPGKFRAAFMYGKFNNAVTDISLYNNLNNNTPLYKRMGFAAKVGYGSADNYFECSYLQAKDDSNSLPGVHTDTIYTKPAANQVAGIKGKITPVKRLTLEVDAAISYFTRDITEQRLNLGAPLKGLAATKPRTTSQVAMAGEARLRYTFNLGNVNLAYRRVDPNYISMGSFYMQTDIAQYTAGFSLSLWKHKLNWRARFGWQRNNLAHNAANNSHRTIGNIGISFNPKPNMGIDIQYSNYGISQQVIPQLRDPATIVRYDSVRISQVNHSVSLSPHLLISGRSMQHSISLQAGLQALKNLNDKQQDNDFTSASASLIYALLMPRKKISITNSLNYFNTKLTGNRSGLAGYNLGISKVLDFRSAAGNPTVSSLALGLNGGYFMNRLNGASTGNTLTISPSVRLAFLKRHAFQLTANYISSDNKVMTGSENQRLMLSARYNISF